MKKFNKSKVIIPALAMIALTTAASATGTVAWFSANTVATVSGMAMKATAGSNLLIAKDTIDSVTKVAENKFGADLTLTASHDIKPVSTIDGKKFYYTSNALANGDAANGATFKQLNVTVGDGYNVIDTSYKGFLEYVFQLKAVNTASAKQYIDLTALGLTYNPTSSTEETRAKAIHAYRAAFFVEDITDENPTGDVGTKNAIYAQDHFDHFTKNTDTNPGTNQAISGTDGSTADVSYVSEATPLAEVASGSTKYYKVVVRAYLEGEDTTCNNAQFLGVTAGWSLNLGVTLQNATTPSVTKINTTVNAAPTPNTGN